MKKKFKLQSENNSYREIFLFVLLFITTVLVVYKTNTALVNIYFLFMVFISYNSKKDYFWIAFFILIYSYPGRIFYGNSQWLNHRLPLYNIFSGVSLGLDDIFPMMLFIKTIIKKKLVMYNNKYILVFTIIIIGAFVVSFLWGVSVNNIISSIRHFIVMLIYFPIVHLIRVKEVPKFIRLLSIIVILALIFTIMFYFLGMSVGSYISGQSLERLSWGTELQEIDSFSTGVSIIRYIDSINILFTLFTVSLYLVLSKTKLININYLLFIFLSSIFIVILSGTRGWTLGFLLVLFLSIIKLKIKKGLINKVVMVLLGLFLILVIFEPLRIQTRNAIIRISTISSITSGDITAGGTDARTEVGIKFFEKGIESPFVGFGISDIGQEYFNSDIGMPSLFIQVGFIGLIMLTGLSINYLWSIKKLSNKMNNQHYTIFIYGFIGMIFMHSTSNILFSLTKTGISTYWVPFYFGVTHLIIKHGI